VVIYQSGKPEFKGNLHLHTAKSDGRMSPMEAALLYEEKGYDFLAITDHNRLTELPEYRGRMLLVPGIELDEAPNGREVIHLLGIGVDAGFMGRLKPGMKSQDAVDLVNQAGGACILAHPHWSLNRVETVSALAGLSGVEIYNSVSRPPYNGDRADSTFLLDQLAADGSLYPTTAADDTHFYGEEVAQSYVLLQADALTVSSVVSSLREGRFYASQGPRFESVTYEGGVVTVACSAVKTVLFHSNLVWSDFRVVSGESVTHASYRVEKARGERFIRVILIDGEGRRAWMKPFAV